MDRNALTHPLATCDERPERQRPMLSQTCPRGLLEGRLALVTGGGAGIGAGTARDLVAHGSDLVVAGTTPSALERTADDVVDGGWLTS